MRIFLTIAILSWFCSPLFAKIPRGQIDLVCVDAKGDVSFIGNADGKLELDQELFKQAEKKYQADKAKQEIDAQEVHEINERNRIEYERLVSEAKANYEKNWPEDHRDEIRKNRITYYSREIGGGMVAAVAFAASGVTLWKSIQHLSDFGMIIYGAMGSSALALGVGYLVWNIYQQIVPEVHELTPPPFKGLDWFPAEVGYAAIERKPESAERRFQVFVPYSPVNHTVECTQDRVLKAQDPADGYLYPVHFKY